MREEEDFLRRGASGALLLIAALLVLRFIPAFTLFGVEVRRVDILSQIVDQVDETKGWEVAELEARKTKLDTEEFKVDMRKVQREVKAARVQTEPKKEEPKTPSKTTSNEIQSWSDLLRQQRGTQINREPKREDSKNADNSADNSEEIIEVYVAPKANITGGVLAKSGKGKDLVSRRTTRVGLIPAGERVLSSRIDLTEIIDFEKQNYIENRGLKAELMAPNDLPFSAMDRVYAKLATPKQTTRIAFLGDSFIEADILTADFRESLQEKYGGYGAGFVPFASVVSRYRKTIRSATNEWTIHNIMQRKKTPKNLADWWFVSGSTCTPNADGASVKWTTVDSRVGVDRAYNVRLLFASENGCEIETKINDGEWIKATIKGSKWLQKLDFANREKDDDAIYSFEVRIVSGFENFIGYGAQFEGKREEGGVVVDNYSIRSNDGQAVLWTNPALNARFDSFFGGYDLVVLQYGLNIMERGVSDYSEYGEQLKKLINYTKSCFPNAAILVMGVSDRSTRKNGRFEPLEEAKLLADCQREVAREAGLSYWGIYDAMQRRGGMTQFVNRDWAGKDYTHLNFDGGREVGRAFAEAIHVARYRSFPIVTEVGKSADVGKNTDEPTEKSAEKSAEK